MTAMTAATLDTLSGGRFRLGLGVSGPQVSEGWHGVRFDKPLEQDAGVRRDRAPRAARERLTYEGEHWTLPLPDGAGKALRLSVHPVRDAIPIYLAAVGPRNLELTGEIADGWLAIFYAPEYAHELLDPIERDASGPERRDLIGFDVVPTVPVVVGDDFEGVHEPVRHYAALYVGGMGSRAELLQPAGRADGVRRGCRTRAGAVSAAASRPFAAVPFSSSTAPRCSGHTAHRRTPARVRRFGRDRAVGGAVRTRSRTAAGLLHVAAEPAVHRRGGVAA